LLDDLGAKNTRITVTNDLDEYAIAALAAVPVDAYGVGTSVATGSGAPTAGFVYKLVSHQSPSGEWINVAKTSAHKANLAGRKTAVRRHDSNGVATAELVHAQTSAEVASGSEAQPGAFDRNLIVDIIVDGAIDEKFVGIAGTQNARAHHAEAIKAMPAQALRLTRGEPGISTLLS